MNKLHNQEKETLKTRKEIDMTKKEALTIAIAALSNDNTNDEVVTTLRNMIAALDKRAETPRKPSAKELAKKEETALFRAKVVDAMSQEPNRLWQVKELADLLEVSTPKMSAALTALKKEGRVKREEGFNGKVITFQYQEG